MFGARLGGSAAALPAGLGRRGPKVVAEALRLAALTVEREWKNQLSGRRTADSLGRETGTLARSIGARPMTPTRWYVGTPVIYARIHEFGGVIVPKRAPYLRFRTRSGAWVTTAKVVMPKRPHRKPAVEKAVETLDRELSRIKPL